MRNLYLAQVNYLFGTNAFLPYSVGRLWAYARTQDGVVWKGWSLCEFLWKREPASAVVARMRPAPPDLLGLSNYIWNEQYNLALALATKAAFPSCIIVLGGPQVPAREDAVVEYLATHPYLDVLVHGEGEHTFARLLEGIPYDQIPGISFRSFGQVITGSAQRLESLDALPSPYLMRVFDPLLTDDESEIEWQALQETNRGCPYACVFCDWGSATLSKVRAFPVDLVKREIEWFGHERIELLYNCDSNFGMLKQDEEIAAALVDVNRRTKYPKKFRAAYAKKITDRVFAVARTLSDAGLSKGATISFQSLDDSTLKAVKRLNPVQRSLAETFAKYHTAGIPTYSEMILGLPGETYESFLAGIDALLEAGQHDGLSVYPCMVLRNSELNDPIYRDVHGLKTHRVRQLLLHGSPDASGHPEHYDLVTATATLDHAAWKDAWTVSLVIQALHGGGITQDLARRARAQGTSYRHFYEELISWARVYPETALGRILQWWDRSLAHALAGGEWRTIFREWGDVQWPIEEAMLLQVIKDRSSFYAQLPVSAFGLHRDDVREQFAICPSPHDDPWNGDLKAFAREAIWYGRKGKKPNPSLNAASQ